MQFKCYSAACSAPDSIDLSCCERASQNRSCEGGRKSCNKPQPACRIKGEVQSVLSYRLTGSTVLPEILEHFAIGLDLPPLQSNRRALPLVPTPLLLLLLLTRSSCHFSLRLLSSTSLYPAQTLLYHPPHPPPLLRSQNASTLSLTKMGLSQEKVGNLLKRATSTLEVEEVLKAYCFA